LERRRLGKKTEKKRSYMLIGLLLTKGGTLIRKKRSVLSDNDPERIRAAKRGTIN